MLLYRAPLDQLPNTGLSETIEENLSSIYVTFPEWKYGTRTQSVVLLDHKSQWTVLERNIGPEGVWSEPSVFRFQTEGMSV